MKGKNKIMKQWNHQRENVIRKKKTAGITANSLELQKREQINTKQSIQQRIKI